MYNKGTETLKHRPKTRRTVELINRIAHSLGPEERLPTVLELRDQLQVSKTTLNDALAELEAQKIIYRRAGIGMFVTARVQRSISLVCDPMFFQAGSSSPFWDMLVRQTRALAQSHDAHFDLYFASIHGEALALPTGLSADISAGRTSGVLYIGTFKEGVEWIERQGVPVVVYAGPGSFVVFIDHNDILRAGAQALGQLGCKRIALARPDDRATEPEIAEQFNSKSIESFCLGLGQAHAPFVPELVRPVHTTICEGLWTPAHSAQALGYEIGRHWFSLPQTSRPDGIVIAEDLMALGVLAAAQECGVEIGRDLMIATHSNVGSAMLIGWNDRIVMLEVDPAMLASAMLDLLERRMDRNPDVSHQVTIKPSVAVGAKLHAASFCGAGISQVSSFYAKQGGLR